MNALKKYIVYGKMSVKAMGQNPSLHTFSDLVRFFPQWLKHLAPGRNSVTDQTPWLTFGAIEWISRKMHPNMKVFEYGSGGSTLFWTSRVKEVVSVEHERLWYDKMKKEFDAMQLDQVTYILQEAEDDPHYNQKDPGNPAHYISSDENFVGKKFESYVKQIDRYPDHSFDVIVVDGRARPSCIAHAMIKLKAGGFLVVDNSERKYYLAPFRFPDGEWQRLDFYGAVPYNYHFSQTTIFQKK